jgi:S-adenosylmethionine/arginine decarboxylase-like enzyme
MLDHKHLISKGTLDACLTVEEVTDLINNLVKALNMRYVDTMPMNPVVGYEPNDYPGVSGVGIITTSHIVIHTWDNTKQYQLDIYSCKNFKKSDVDIVLSLYGMLEDSGVMFDRNYEIKQLWPEEKNQTKEQ